MLVLSPHRAGLLNFDDIMILSSVAAPGYIGPLGPIGGRTEAWGSPVDEPVPVAMAPLNPGGALRGSFGGLLPNDAEEAAFLRNAAATFTVSSVYSAATRFSGSIVVQRSDIPFSIQNVRRMAGGNSPFVRNHAGEWEKLNLHHVGRAQGYLIEVLSSHNVYNPATGGPLHIAGPGSPIRDAAFARNYWTHRLQDAIDAGRVPRNVLRDAGL